MDAWQTVYSYQAPLRGNFPRTVLGKPCLQRRCRFCGNTQPTVSFRKDAHVIPAALGNRSLLSWDECDTCNEHLGSPLEDDLAKLLGPARVFYRVRSRSGRPKIRIPGKQAFLQQDGEKDGVYFFDPGESEPFLTEDLGNGKLKVTVPIAPYRPIGVARAIARMAAFVLPVDYPGIDQILAWIRGEIKWYPVPLATFVIPGAGLNLLAVSVSKYNFSNECALHRVTFMFSSVVMMLQLPFSGWTLPTSAPFIEGPAEVLPSVLRMFQNASAVWINDEAIATTESMSWELSYSSHGELSDEQASEVRKRFHSPK